MERAGQRRALVRFEQEGAAANDGGVVTEGWAPFFGPVRARLRPMRGGETVLANRLTGVENFELTVLGCAQVRKVTSDFRVVVVNAPGLAVGTVLAITDIQNPDEQGREFLMLLQRGKANA